MKELLFKNKSILISLLVSISIGIIGGNGNLPQNEYDKLVNQRDSQVIKISEVDSAISREKETNAILVAEKAEKERIAKEEAEKKAKEEAAKKAEEERLAKEEAERKAEEERLAKEEADRIAREEADRIAQAEQANTVYNNTSGNNTGYESNEPIGQMVWLSETGEKYHSINNCGRMNPNKARQVTLESAQNSYGRCSKCW